MTAINVVDCETRERAIQPAAQVPDARITTMEVRPIMFSAGQDR
ncbi:YciI family protein [Streptosporangium soli]